MSDGYNGYANYETWNVVLWLSNDEDNYMRLRRQVWKHYDELIEGDLQTLYEIVYGIFNVDPTIQSRTPDRVFISCDEIDWTEVYEACVVPTMEDINCG